MPEATYRIVESYGRQLLLEDAQGQRHLGLIKGKRLTALVGDWVNAHASGDSWVITHVLERRNVFFRQDELRTKSFAANIDQVLVFLGAEPIHSDLQLGRALLAAAAQDIPVAIALNKMDLSQAFADAQHRLAKHDDWGCPLFCLQLEAPQQGLEPLKAWLKNRSTLVVGPSGTGKSTLINTLVPGSEVKTQTISLALNSGKHTTTRTTWHWADAARTTALIDSPGFQEFGIRHLQAEQLQWLMPDLKAHLGNCRFSNCQHLHEPNCGVLLALEAGQIDPMRHRIYTQLHAELKPQ